MPLPPCIFFYPVICLSRLAIILQAGFDKEYTILLEQIRLLRAQIYGRKSEKVVSADGPVQLPLFGQDRPGSCPD
jgi:hypothetical protein